ncbi:MAG: ChaN family lipoprotein [Bacteroidetes bacterium]|nr:ChaN family lipoprotein [Bacteroidota bacterium]
MQKNIKWLALWILISAFGMKGDKPAYTIFNGKGKRVEYQKMLDAALKADVVLFGELHNNPICHWLELELTKDIYKTKLNDLVLGAEMFESDNQKALDSFLEGHYDAKQLKQAARLWPNYNTDYEPLVAFAKEKKLNFVASNIPRRYARLVNSRGFEGLDTLSYREKLWIAPLPIMYDSSLPGYAEILKAMGGSGHGSKNIAKAQASKDATMAYFIVKNLAEGKAFIHYNGTYHSNNYEGIVWYLKKYKPGIKIVTIASAEQGDIRVIDNDNKGLADFTIIVTESMTKTY